MYNFPELIKKIRDESGLTQADFARALNVSAVLIAMIETGQKEVSKNFILKLAKLLHVHPVSITPFLFASQKGSHVIGFEKDFLNWGQKMQILLINKRAKKLKKYAQH